MHRLKQKRTIAPSITSQGFVEEKKGALAACIRDDNNDAYWHGKDNNNDGWCEWDGQ